MRTLSIGHSFFLGIVCAVLAKETLACPNLTRELIADILQKNDVEQGEEAFSIFLNDGQDGKENPGLNRNQQKIQDADLKINKLKEIRKKNREKYCADLSKIQLKKDEASRKNYELEAEIEENVKKKEALEGLTENCEKLIKAVGDVSQISYLWIMGEEPPNNLDEQLRKLDSKITLLKEKPGFFSMIGNWVKETLLDAFRKAVTKIKGLMQYNKKNAIGAERQDLTQTLSSQAKADALAAFQRDRGCLTTAAQRVYQQTLDDKIKFLRNEIDANNKVAQEGDAFLKTENAQNREYVKGLFEALKEKFQAIRAGVDQAVEGDKNKKGKKNDQKIEGAEKPVNVFAVKGVSWKMDVLVGKKSDLREQNLTITLNQSQALLNKGKMCHYEVMKGNKPVGFFSISNA